MHTKNFKQLTNKDVNIAGGKGASLGEMTNANIPVPPGFVVLAGAFDVFLKETDLGVEIEAALSKTSPDDINSVEKASDKIRDLIRDEDFPDDLGTKIIQEYKKLEGTLVAVRSSATAEDSSIASWAGELESFMNVTEKNLLETVKKCWSSLFTPRAIFYRYEKNLRDQKISVAVVVQEMVQSEISGITFTVHPVTEDRNQMVIEAGWGLGDAIVGGMITPDTYVINKSALEIEDVNVSRQKMMLVQDSFGHKQVDVPEPKQEKQKLSQEQIIKLAKLCVDIENHYGFPCDIEWAFEGGKFYITQSRPITTLKIENSKTEDALLMRNTQSREHSLAYFYIWQIANQTRSFGWFENIQNLLFVNNGLHKKTKIYYAAHEIERIFSETGLRSKKEKNFFEKVSQTFIVLTKELSPYFTFQKQIKSASEWESFNEKMINWWAAMAVIFVLPESPTAPKNIREKALLLRIKTEKYSGVGDEVMMEYLYKYFPKFKDLAWLMTPGEISAIENLRETEIKEIERRKNGYVLFNGKLFEREALESILVKNNLQLEKNPSSSSEEVSGTIASPGIAQGEVVLVSSRKDLEKVSENSILVTEMTSPEYVPYMKKAKAVVTEEGGVNCHAAIVSRELKKPCIIGTKVATQVLKDGDQVEVDADEGVVKIIEKKDEEKRF